MPRAKQPVLELEVEWAERDEVDEDSDTPSPEGTAGG